MGESGERQPPLGAAADAGRDGAPDPAQSVGAILRARRDGSGQSIQDAARALRIRAVFLEAMEENRFGDLPGTPYALGFLRAYATWLGLDGDALARRVKADEEHLTRRNALVFPEPLPARTFPAGGLVALGVALVAVIYGAWWHLNNPDLPPVADAPPPASIPVAEESPPADPEVSEPIVSQPVAEEAPASPGADPDPALDAPATDGVPDDGLGAASAPDAAVALPPVPAATIASARVLLRAVAESWIEIYAADGARVHQQLLAPGDVYPVPARPDLLLITGNAGGLEIIVDGAPQPPIGPSGSVRRNVSLNPDDLKGGGA